MKCYVGIDLGSTTTKAVILGEDGALLGRGITNSRSNYDVACAVARNEALVDARFHLFGAALDAARGWGTGGGEFLARLRRAFELEQHLHLLNELEGACGVAAEQAARRPDAPSGATLMDLLDSIFERLRDRAARVFAAGERPRSDFFRDVAGAGYMAEAERLARESGVSYELLLGLYDKSILAVESHVPETSLEASLSRALARVAPDAPEDLERQARAVCELLLDTDVAIGTGYGRARLPFPREHIRSEILCHGLGAHAAFPGSRTVLDIGGQDTKAIQLDAAGVVTSFQMNDRCAAGCGRYLGYIADEMNLGLHELGPLACRSCTPVKISSTCTVFAGAELRDRLATGQRQEDILAGLHRAIMLRATSLLARSGGVSAEFTFTGGVARNEAAVRALRGLVRDGYGIEEINISADSIYTGALGAAIFALREGSGEPGRLPQGILVGGAA